MVSRRSLSDNKSPQVSGTLLSILADLNNAVVWMVSTRPLIFKFSSPCTNPLMTVPRAPITIGINLSFMIHSFSVLLQGPGTYLIFFRFPSVLLCGKPGQQSPPFASSLFLLIITRSYHAIGLMSRVFGIGPGDGVQSQVESYQRPQKWYLMPPCLTLSIIRYGSRVKWTYPGKE